MKWMRDLHLNNVVFELDSKRMVDSFKHIEEMNLCSETLSKIVKMFLNFISQTLILSLLEGKQMRSLTV
jgi:hypothetical protein